MPRPRPKKIVTARPAPVARHHSTTSIKSGLTVNGPVNDEAPITASGDELPRQTRLGSRIKRNLSTKKHGAAKPSARRNQESEVNAEDDASGGEGPEASGEAVIETETLVQATPEEVLVRMEQGESAANATETGTLDAPSTGGRSKRLKEKAADVVRRVSSRRQSRRVSGSPAPKLPAEPEEHLPSSPPLYAQAPASIARIQATPSFLTNFRKQPRQPSILRMVQQSVGVLGSDDEDLTFGEETDLLADMTTTTALAQDQSQVLDDEGLYDEDVPPVLSSSSRKRKASMLGLDNEEVIPSSIRGTPIHRHDATVLPSDPASLPEMAQIPNDPTDELSPDDSASHKARSSPPLEDNPQSDNLPSPRKNVRPRRPGRVRGQKSTAKLVLPVIHSSSSVIEASSPHSTPPSSPINTQAQQAQQQKSKATTATRKGSKREKVVAVTTAALQALLPKRKVEKSARTRDTFDIHSSSTEPSNEDEEIDEEEDELSRPARRRAQQTQPSRSKPGALKSPKAVRGKAAGHILMTKSVTTRQARAKQSPTKAPTGRVSKTYARQSRGEQENDEEDANVDDEQEDDVDATIITADGQVNGGELRNVRKKFEQVDQWELEFESADVGGDSSPWR